MTGKIRWEEVGYIRGSSLVSERLKTHKGWIVRTTLNNEDSRSGKDGRNVSVAVSVAVHQVIVDDPKYEWKI